ncbi:hypothetical protein KUCAC02_034490, partial [Chaenocephalus aceratus]
AWFAASVRSVCCAGKPPDFLDSWTRYIRDDGCDSSGVKHIVLSPPHTAPLSVSSPDKVFVLK